MKSDLIPTYILGLQVESGSSPYANRKYSPAISSLGDEGERIDSNRWHHILLYNRIQLEKRQFAGPSLFLVMRPHIFIPSINL